MTAGDPARDRDDDRGRALAWGAIAASDLPARVLVELLQAFGSPQALVAAPATRIAKIAGDRAAARLSRRDDERTRALAAWLEDPSHRIVAWGDDDYPPRLMQAPDPPPVLFVLGLVALLARPSIAIVGSRHATPQGLDDAQAFAATLAGAGLTIVSGLALGIDAAAHRGALGTEASTVAVTGTGPDRVYPSSHRDLAHAIAQKGAIATEFVPGTPPLKPNFPRRNRVIAGLALGVLVIEAAPQSGSLITARLALEADRDVFAVPGSIHSPLSKGPHRLIREGAKLVETAQDVLVELGLAGAKAPVAPKDAPDPVSPEMQSVLEAMGHGPVDFDRIVTRSGLKPDAIAAILVELELAGRASALPGGRWQRRGG